MRKIILSVIISPVLTMLLFSCVKPVPSERFKGVEFDSFLYKTRISVMAKNKTILVSGTEITTCNRGEKDYISLTDIAKYRNTVEPFSVINNWMRSKSTIDFIGLWEKINNPSFNPIEFERFKDLAGSNSFSLTPKRSRRHYCSRI